MFFSIIIINYKTPQLTIQCINSILALPNPENKEIIVIDNASNDGSFHLLKKIFQNKIYIISNKINLGFSGANNQGAIVSRGDILLFLNSDTIIEEDIFNEINNLFKKNDKIGIISPLLLSINQKPQSFAFGFFPTIWKLIKRTNLKKINIQSHTETLTVDWVSGCAFAIRKSLLKELGGWDDNFFLYFEDIDLCKRAHEMGYKTLVALNIRIIHLGGKSLVENNTRKKYYYESQDYYFKKNGKKYEKFLVIIFRKFFKLFKKLNNALA